MKEFLSIIWHKRVIVTPKKERQKVSISNVEWFSASFSIVYMFKHDPKYAILNSNNRINRIACIILSLSLRISII